MSTQQGNLKKIADAIRAKEGTTEPIIANDFATRIANLPSGGGSKYTGTVDSVGLTALGYTTEDITHFQEMVFWDSEEDYLHVISDANIALVGASLAEIQANQVDVMYLPKSVVSQVSTASAFRLFSNLELVILPNVTDIGAHAFRDTHQLRGVYFYESLTNIGSSAFYNDYNLQLFGTPINNVSLGTLVFTFCRMLDTKTSGKTIIGFKGCSSITAIKLSDTATSVAQEAFSECYGLYDVVIPTMCTTIITLGFYKCLALKRVKVEGELERIGARAFDACTNLQIFDLRETSVVPVLDNISAFNNTHPNLKIIVPLHLEDEFKTATNWITFADKIIGV